MEVVDMKKNLTVSTENAAQVELQENFSYEKDSTFLLNDNEVQAFECVDMSVLERETGSNGLMVRF